MAEFPGKGKVAIVKTTPDTVLEDVREVMRLAGYQDALPKDKDTILKINISWDTWYPACSSTPWQIEGVIQELQAAGYSKVVAGHNDTVVVDARVGETNNKHRYVTDKYGKENVCQIITFGTLKARAAVRDIARVLRVSPADADRIAKLVA